MSNSSERHEFRPEFIIDVPNAESRCFRCHQFRDADIHRVAEAEAQSIAEPEPAEKFEFNDPEASLRREPSLTMKIGEGGHSDFFHTAKVEPELLPCPWDERDFNEIEIVINDEVVAKSSGPTPALELARNALANLADTRSRPTETAEVRRQVWDEAIAIAKAEAYERRMAYCVVAVLKAARDAAPAPADD